MNTLPTIPSELVTHYEEPSTSKPYNRHTLAVLITKETFIVNGIHLSDTWLSTPSRRFPRTKLRAALDHYLELGIVSKTCTHE